MSQDPVPHYEIDWDTAVRLNLYDFLLCYLLAYAFVGADLDEEIAAFAEECHDTLQRVQFPRALTQDEREEWQLRSGMLVQKLTDRIRRAHRGLSAGR